MTALSSVGLGLSVKIPSSAIAHPRLALFAGRGLLVVQLTRSVAKSPFQAVSICAWQLTCLPLSGKLREPGRPVLFHSLAELAKSAMHEGPDGALGRHGNLTIDHCFRCQCSECYRQPICPAGRMGFSTQWTRVRRVYNLPS